MQRTRKISLKLKNRPLYIIYSAMSIVIISLLNICLTSFTKINNTYAESVDYNVTIKPSLNLTTSSSQIVLNLNPITKQFESQDLTVSVGTNSNYGYKLYVSTNNDDTNLIEQTDNTRTIPTLTSNNNGNGYTIDNFPEDKWGYTLNGNSSSSIVSSNYYPFISNTLVSSSNGPTNNISTTMSFAAKISHNTAPGAYATVLNFKALPIVTQTYMQNMDPTLCTEDPTVVIDNRDEQAYLIRRLPDGKCWMLDNLNLDLTNKDIVDKLKGTDETGSNTNASSAALNYMRKGGGESTNQWANTGLTYTNWGDSYSYSQPLVNRSGKCDPDKNSSSQCLSPYQGADYTSNTVIAVNDIGDGSYKIGTYYNYCAATAGSYCYGNGINPGSSATGNATMDICPAGWRLPTGDNDNGETKKLIDIIKSLYPSEYQNIRSQNSLQSILSTPLSGAYSSTTAWRQGVSGEFWSSTFYNTARMYFLNVGVNTVNDWNHNSRPNGYPVRCLLNES